MATVLRCDDWIETVKLAADPAACLARLREIVAGEIDAVGVGDLVLVINAEGKLLGLPLNERATMVARPYLLDWDWGIAGDAVLARWEELEGLDPTPAHDVGG